MFDFNLVKVPEDSSSQEESEESESSSFNSSQVSLFNSNGSNTNNNVNNKTPQRMSDKSIISSSPMQIDSVFHVQLPTPQLPHNPHVNQKSFVPSSTPRKRTTTENSSLVNLFKSNSVNPNSTNNNTNNINSKNNLIISTHNYNTTSTSENGPTNPLPLQKPPPTLSSNNSLPNVLLDPLTSPNPVPRFKLANKERFKARSLDKYYVNSIETQNNSNNNNVNINNVNNLSNDNYLVNDNSNAFSSTTLPNPVPPKRPFYFPPKIPSKSSVDLPNHRFLTEHDDKKTVTSPKSPGKVPFKNSIKN
eukprot:TRINITY_DN16913_c0_g1_i1.p1 TRINITY_DN16913_c0_g1~~TRINITY_DN16913_c0_g1_i1.p1  ORF type:complete len:304 (+),score=77.70 TRINITY_DN16913_c0_g1_i1:541-1452(+)